jgi:hypothetical protein
MARRRQNELFQELPSTALKIFHEHYQNIDFAIISLTLVRAIYLAL